MSIFQWRLDGFSQKNISLYLYVGFFSKTVKSRVSHRVRMITRWPGRERWPEWPIDPVTQWPSSMSCLVWWISFKLCVSAGCWFRSRQTVESTTVAMSRRVRRGTSSDRNDDVTESVALVVTPPDMEDRGTTTTVPYVLIIWYVKTLDNQFKRWNV